MQALGTGITLDSPLALNHAINAVVRDAAVTTAGYQGMTQPNQWFGGPALSPAAGSMVLRDAAGLVVDSLNYGLLVDPWAAEGYQAASGSGQSGCRVDCGPAPAGRTSAGRFPDGADADSNCTDFLTQSASTLAAASAVGATNIKVASVADFDAGQSVLIDAGANPETAVIATVGTAGASTMRNETGVGATMIQVASTEGFSAGQTITIDSGANMETAVVATTARRGPGPHHRHRAAQVCACGRRSGLRYRHHPCWCIGPSSCQRGADRRQRSTHARCAQPVLPETSLMVPVQLTDTAYSRVG